MAKVCLQSLAMETYGEMLEVGAAAPGFILTQADLMPVGLSDFKNKKILLNVFPSIDTKVCFTSLMRYQAQLDKVDTENLVILSVSMDLPYALARSQHNYNFSNLTLLSDFRDHRFGVDYGVLITSGPLTGLLARSLFAIDEHGIIQYAELSAELNTACQFEKALKTLINF